MEEKASPEIWTPLKILHWAVPYLAQRGLPQPKLDVEIILAHALQLDRLKVYLQFDRPLNPQELALIRGLLKRRALQEPLQYLTGQREFYGFPFRVSPAALIPRPETEGLVEEGIHFLEKLPPEERLVLDLGTGSGCIALSIAKTLSCRVWAVDLSPEALELAKGNSQALEVEGLEFRQGDWFSALRPEDPRQFALILSNPPYIPLGEREGMDPEVRDFEPSLALFGGEDGLKEYWTLFKDLAKWLHPQGLALLELHDQGYEKIQALGLDSTWEMSSSKDLRGIPRILKLKRIQAS